METNNDEDNQGQNSEKSPPALEKHPVSENPELVSDNAERGKIAELEQRLTQTQRWEFRFSGVIAFSAIVSAFIASLQWHSMQGQLEEMRGSSQQTDRLIAEITEQARAAQDSLNVSRLHFQREQRPYVMPRIYPIIFSPNQKIVVNIFSGNYGKTPAMKVGTAARIFYGKNALAEAYKWFSQSAQIAFSRPYGPNIPPGTPASSIEAMISFKDTNQIISEKEFNSLATKDFTVVVAVRQAYADILGNEYWTDFCVGRLANGDGAIAYCPQHNEIH